MDKKKVVEEFSTWERAEQLDLINRLHVVLKPQRGVLKVKADIKEVGLVLKYCNKRGIEHDCVRHKNKVHFIFYDKAIRNEVLIGIRTL